MKLGNLIEMSNRYGKSEDYVLAGGGNTSYKDEGVLYVKGSGTQLATIQEQGFVQMDMGKLLSMLQKEYPGGDKEREAAALEDMMAARLPGQEGMRPSVECLLHAVFTHTYILHLHPALVNGLTCGQTGAADCQRLLPEALWIPLTKPGYILAKTCYDAFNEYEKKNGKAPQVVFLQNHGIFVAANTVQEIDQIMNHVMGTLQSAATEVPNLEPLAAPEAAEQLAPALRMLYAGSEENAFVAFCNNAEVQNIAQSEQTMQPLMLPFTPDHIVYCKAKPLYVEDAAKLQDAFASYEAKEGYKPKVAVLKNIGMFAMGKSKKEADIAVKVFLDGVKIAVYSRAFGGPLQLDKDFTDFILNWEVEAYRQKIALSNDGSSRMKGKICIVTGGAQGFGEGIARGIVSQGGNVVLADMNEAGAVTLAEELNQTYGPGTALGVAVNVSDETSVAEMVRKAVLAYGGLDVMVACAGIAIAGDMEEMTLDKFNRVTGVNYAGYFLCAKYASRPMKIQHQYAPARLADIIEINSKSGLEGSKNNFAYAGSKFGGIGLTQSFALELVQYGIKVNAICPGNLLDGPLWSDPERGLFRQYLEAGKVPGAKTVEDVRRFYESKVPMNRGCTTGDVARAVYYLVEQQYETGQALPVTGGQVMLS